MIGPCRFCGEPITGRDIWTTRTSPVTQRTFRVHYRCRVWFPIEETGPRP